VAGSPVASRACVRAPLPTLWGAKTGQGFQNCPSASGLIHPCSEERSWPECCTDTAFWLVRVREVLATVSYEVSDQFVAAFNCHCSNCRAATGSAFLPWGEIEREKLKVTKGAGSLMVSGDADADYAMRCRSCGSLLYWTVHDRQSRVQLPRTGLSRPRST
jgi:hypothetical protein